MDLIQLEIIGISYSQTQTGAYALILSEIIAGLLKKEGILICEINLNAIEKTRQHWPFLRDRRIDAYKGIIKNPRDE